MFFIRFPLLSDLQESTLRMLTTFRPALLSGLLIAVLSLTACKDDEEWAEEFYQSGLALLAAGDTDRALVEFRNVFKHDGFHKDARLVYAETQLARGETGEATSQYLRLIEQYPDTIEVRVKLAELALARGDWAEVERHGQAGMALDAAAPGVQALRIALDYRTAVLDRDEPARARLAEEARILLDSDPDNLVSRRVLIDQQMHTKDSADALTQIDAALATNPKQLDFQMLKFRILAEAEDLAGTGAHLQQMFALYPENDQVKGALIGWYLAQKDIDGAEAFLRDVAGPVTGAPEGHVAVVQLLQAARSPEAAQAELDALIASNAGTANAELYGALRAAIDFQAGKTEAAIGAMEVLVEGAEASDQTRKLKAMLAQMRDATGNRVGARALVEEVLAEDASNVEALKMRGAWLIADDKPGDAIVDLRNALNQNPRDPAILTLMASAHERDGNLDLMGERLGLAVEVSGSGAAESLRYAQFLQRQKRIPAAEAVLTEAARANPRSPEVLTALAEISLAQKKWLPAQAAITALRKLGLPQTQATVQRLQAATFLGQNRTEESLAFLTEQVEQGNSDITGIAMIVQTQIVDGKLDAARDYLDDAMAERPDSRPLRLLSAGLDALRGDVAAAEAQYRALIAEAPAEEVPVRQLYKLLAATGQSDQATAVVEAGLQAAPKSATLRWIKAGALNETGDIDGAVAIYEELYAENTANVVVANNLASLITTYRDDPEGLERAFAIARRLRGSTVPAFQDTYGWIEYRRGNLQEALLALEPAAAGLPDDALTQFHLGMTYADLGETAKAITQFERVMELAGDSDLPQVDTARTRLEALRNPAPAAP